MHLDDATVLELVEGRLPPEAIATADEHLDACASCRDVVALLASARGSAPVLARGDVIGKYVLGDLLGAGAMGRVYSAWEPELDRRVALKVLREDAGGRARIVQEAQAMAKLSHPNVVTVHEVGETADGVYVAMELVAGDTLRAWAAARRPWRDVARVLVEVARGLAAVHAAGVVHRDLKPENVIVGDDGRIRIGDFGLARADGMESANVEASAVAGTPAYMAPEVLRGGRADPASDQFSFGVVAYELLAGRRPHGGATWSQLLRSLESGPPVALRDTPSWLDAIVRRCLSVDPGQRFAGMREVADRIEERVARRSPAVWLAAALGAAVLASGATWLALGGGQTRRACTVDDAELAAIWNAGVRAKLASAPVTAAIDRWARDFHDQRLATCAVNELPAKAAARSRCLDQRRAELGTLLARASTDRVLDALALLPSPTECALADAGASDPLPLDPAQAAAAEEVDRALPGLRAAIALGDARGSVDPAAALVAKARTSEHAPTLAEALIVSADALHGAGRLADAATTARDAVATAERGHADDVAARAWLSREAIAGERRDLDAAEDIGAIASGAIARAGTPPRLAAALARMRGLVAYERGRLADARALLLDARTRFVALAGEKSVDVSAVESALGSVARAAGDLDEAELRHRSALAIDRELRAPVHPDIARDLHNVAGVLRLRGDLERALATYHDALAVEEAAQGKRSIAAGLTHNSIGLVLMARREWKAAAEELTTARDILDAAGHGDRAFAEHNLGLVAQATGDHHAALEHFARAAAVYATTVGDLAPGPTRLLLDRARSERALGDEPAARKDAELARDRAKFGGIAWIVDDATVLLSERPAAPVAVVKYDRVGAEPRADHGAGAPATTTPAPTPPPAPQPQPRRDVGVYGSSVTF
jgi:tetratricopeptide (TPR) repeat protein